MPEHREGAIYRDKNDKVIVPSNEVIAHTFLTDLPENQAYELERCLKRIGDRSFYSEHLTKGPIGFDGTPEITKILYDIKRQTVSLESGLLFKIKIHEPLQAITYVVEPYTYMSEVMVDVLESPYFEIAKGSIMRLCFLDRHSLEEAFFPTPLEPGQWRKDGVIYGPLPEDYDPDEVPF